MKIIAVSNFNIESIPDRLVAEGITSQTEADTMVEALNKTFGGTYSRDFYQVVPDDHKLWGGMEELV